MLNIGGLMEWILGNTFPAIVFFTFGTFWLSFGGILSPSFSAFASYAPPEAKSPTEGLMTPGFNASLGKSVLFLYTASYHICVADLWVVKVSGFYSWGLFALSSSLPLFEPTSPSSSSSLPWLLPLVSSLVLTSSMPRTLLEMQRLLAD